MNFSIWLENKNNFSKSEMARAKHADLIELPKNIEGTNCGNCRFVKKTKEGAFCEHKEVQLPVTPRMCCAYWDNKDVKRPWGEMEL